MVFDIRSGMVGGVLFETRISGIPRIILSVREPILPEEDINVGKLLTLTLGALDKVSDKIYKAGLGAPSRIFCVLSSPWYFSQTRLIHLKKNAPFMFNTKLADSLIHKEIKLFEEEHAVKYGGSVRAVELKNIKTLLNGYETPDPLDKKTKELQMSIFISMSGEQVLKKIEDTIGKHFHSGPTKFISSAMTSFTIVRDIYPGCENFLLIDVGGEVTDILLVKQNIPGTSISFPLGRNYFVRGVATRLRVSLSEAASLVSLFRDGHAEISVAKKLTPIIDDLSAKWLGQLQESLANISEGASIPSAVYLAGGGEMTELFSTIIKSEQFSQYTLAASKFEIILLNTEMLHGLSTIEENMLREPGLIADSIYINRFLTAAPAGQI